MPTLDQLEQLQTELQAALNMRNTIMTSGQEYMIGRRRMVRPPLAEVNKTIDQLEKKIAELQNTPYSSRLFTVYQKI